MRDETGRHYARTHRAVGLEAYATDPAGSRSTAGMSYTGSTSLLEAAGFRRVVKTGSMDARLPRWLMRLDLVRD